MRVGTTSPALVGSAGALLEAAAAATIRALPFPSSSSAASASAALAASAASAAAAAADTALAASPASLRSLAPSALAYSHRGLSGHAQQLGARFEHSTFPSVIIWKCSSWSSSTSRRAASLECRKRWTSGSGA